MKTEIAETRIVEGNSEIGLGSPSTVMEDEEGGEGKGEEEKEEEGLGGGEEEEVEERFPLCLKNEVKPFKLTNDSSHILEVCTCIFIKNCQFVHNLRQWVLELTKLNRSENDLEGFIVPHLVTMQNTTV